MEILCYQILLLTLVLLVFLTTHLIGVAVKERVAVPMLLLVKAIVQYPGVRLRDKPER